jgi:hypothetical protein
MIAAGRAGRGQCRAGAASLLPGSALDAENDCRGEIARVNTDATLSGAIMKLVNHVRAAQKMMSATMKIS